MSQEKCVVCGGSGMKPDGPLTIRCWRCNPEPKRKHGPMCSCMSCSQAHVQGLVAEAKAEARREALEDAAQRLEEWAGKHDTHSTLKAEDAPASSEMHSIDAMVARRHAALLRIWAKDKP